MDNNHNSIIPIAVNKNNKGKIYIFLKALFTFFAIAFFCASNAFSRTLPADSLETYRFAAYPTAGIHGGVNVSSLTNFNRNDSRLGMHVGLFGQCQISPLLGLSTELNYSQQGTTLHNVEYGLNYLSMPIMLNLHDNDFSVQVGVYGALLLKGKAFYGKITEDVTEHFKPTETGLCLGLSYSFFDNTLVGVRFYRGLQNVNETITDYQLKLQNSTLQITAGYIF